MSQSCEPVGDLENCEDVQEQDPCPVSGQIYLKLTKAEVQAIPDIALTVVKENPRGDREDPQIVSAIFLLKVLEELVGDDDYSKQELNAMLHEAKKLGIGVPQCFLVPVRPTRSSAGCGVPMSITCCVASSTRAGSSSAPRSTASTCSRVWHLLQRGIRRHTSRAVNRSWHASARDRSTTTEPDPCRVVRDRQGAADGEIADLVEKNRAAEKNKRSGSRHVKGKELRAAGYELRGFAGWFKGGKVPKPVVEADIEGKE